MILARVRDLAEGLFYTALDENDVKVTFVSIDLFDKILSSGEASEIDGRC
jgi:hypothetical protein